MFFIERLLFRMFCMFFFYLGQEPVYFRGQVAMHASNYPETPKAGTGDPGRMAGFVLFRSSGLSLGRQRCRQVARCTQGEYYGFHQASSTSTSFKEDFEILNNF